MKMISNDVKRITVICSMATAVVSIICFFINSACGVLCLLLGISITTVFVVCTKKRYKNLSELNNYLSLVLSGEYNLDINENAEGELSILKNNLYKIITTLSTQNAMLKKDKVYLADSLADISHQLKTPLTSMMVMTDLLQESEPGGKEQEFISIIENQLEKMRWLILNLVKLSKLDADTVEFKHELVPIEKVIRESIKPFLVMLDLKGISLINNINDFSFTGDKNWSIEAFENILKNCIEHTDKNGKLIISGKSTNIYDSVIITDNGCGIAPEDLPHIFERFYHGKNSSGDSVGIGLALAKMVFEKENASVSVKSTLGEGTIFEIRFYKAII